MSKKFKLTAPEKRLIYAYVAYKHATVFTPKISDILFMFAWDDPTHERYVRAHRDWLLDDQECYGEFDRVRRAIEDYIEKCKTKCDRKFT